MLANILEELRRSGGALTAAELSRALGVERSALEGMLDLLERKGKLRRAGECGMLGRPAVCGFPRLDAAACGHCPLARGLPEELASARCKPPAG